MTLQDLSELPRSNLRTQLVKKILKAIFTGKLTGGARLVEVELAQQLGVSRTPIREALGELAGIGLILLKPNHGAIVRPFGPHELREIYQVRRLLEVEATRLANGRIDSLALTHLKNRHEELLHKAKRGQRWTEQVILLDQELHELLSISSGSHRLAEEIGRYRTIIAALRESVGNTHHALERALSEHLQIIGSLMNGDADGAGRGMETHLVNGAEAAVAALTEVRRTTPATTEANGGSGNGADSPRVSRQSLNVF